MRSLGPGRIRGRGDGRKIFVVGEHSEHLHFDETLPMTWRGGSHLGPVPGTWGPAPD